MSNQIPPIEEFSPIDEFAIYNQPDWLLQALVGMINRNRSSFDITLHVKGTVLSGVVINAQEYLENLGRLFTLSAKRSARAGGTNFTVEGDGSDLFKDTIEQLYPSTENQTEDNDTSKAGYIHLKNVRLLSPINSPFVGESSYWRFKLSSIDGWILGRAE